MAFDSLKKFFFNRKALDISDGLTYAGKDKGGNVWYLPSWSLDGLVGQSRSAHINYDLRTPFGKAEALRSCYPLAVVMGFVGDMIQNGRFYVTDRDDNEKPRFRPVADLLASPNPMQDGKAFLKNVEIALECFGFCPIYTLRATSGDLPAAMTIIPPELLHMKGTGRLFDQTERSGIVKEAYIMWGGKKRVLSTEEYFIVHDSMMQVPPADGGEITFSSPVDTLSEHARNYMAQLIARGNLIVNGGPKGILYGNDTTDAGNAAITPKEAEEMQSRFRRRYGLVGKLYEIMVTPRKLGWITIGSPTDQLKLFEEDAYCLKAVAQAVGIDPNLVTSGSTYDNSAQAKKSAYQDVILPDAEIISQAFTAALCQGTGARIRLDFSDVDYLQEEKAAQASAVQTMANAMQGLVADGILTREEARRELARYIDINPSDTADAPAADDNNG